MSFRKRNVVVSSPGSTPSSNTASEKVTRAGIRPSLLDGRLTTSTGTRSLDTLLAGHAGLSLGTSMLIEESGTTDFGGALLRYYAAQGIVQGHHVHVLGMHEAWGRELPGLSEGKDSKSESSRGISNDKMKIAWRYERLGEFGAPAGARERNSTPSSAAGADITASPIFCHDFDLSKRLALPSTSLLHFVPISQPPSLNFETQGTTKSPFTSFLQHISSFLSKSSPTSTHRIAIPMLLSPASYPPSASKPEHLLQFLHGLRALLRKYPAQLTALITLPLSLYPRSNGLTRWMELLSDGVLEIAPFPANAANATTLNTSGAATKQEEPPQGMLKIHRLPIFHEKGGGGGESSGLGDDLAFTLSRRKGLVIKPFSLPPVEGDTEAQQGGLEGDHNHGKATKVDIEF